MCQFKDFPNVRRALQSRESTPNKRLVFVGDDMFRSTLAVDMSFLRNSRGVDNFFL